MQKQRSKLKDLKVTKVDFVDNGANPDAHVALFKSKGEAEGAVEPEGSLKKFLSTVAKKLGLPKSDAEDAVEEIAKSGDASTFGEMMRQRRLRRVFDEIWDICYALQESIGSIIRDEEAENKAELMRTSITEFTTAVSGCIDAWAAGETANAVKVAKVVTPDQVEAAKRAKARLEAIIAKAVPPNDDEEEDGGAEEDEPEKPKTKNIKDQKEPDTSGCKKGVHPDMKIDKSKLTPEEVQQLEAIEKKAGIREDTPPAAPTAPAAPVEKTASSATNTPAPAAATEHDDIYKGLHPAVKAELERLTKIADDAEERDLANVAKKYEIIGKKSEELVPVLKSLKAAGGEHYNQMIAILDAGVEAIEKSGIFNEIGKRGGGASGNAWATIEKRADEIMKTAPTMTRAQAIDKACEQNPELVREYEETRQ